MVKRAPGVATMAIAAAQAAGIGFRVHPYVHRAGSLMGYGLEAAAELGVPPERVFKTLVASVDGDLVVGVVPVAVTLDLKALASAVGGRRAGMADVSLAQRATGYVVGGISPLGLRQKLRMVLDVTALSFPTIYVSAGRRGLDLELSPGDLITITGATTARIGRD